MNRLLAQLSPLQATLLLPTTGAPNIAAPSADVLGLIRAIRRKAVFATMHLALLKGVEWERIDGIGRRASDTGEPERLTIRLCDASLVLEHSTAVIDHVYLAFDGLTAALVNMTDTLGRLVRVANDPSLDPRGASLLAVRDRCAVTSALGTVLYDPRHTDWLRKVRELRGRCQHAEIEGVLVSEAGPYARREQPYIDQTYSWSNPARHTPILSYAEEASQAAEDCLVAAIAGIISAPTNPLA